MQKKIDALALALKNISRLFKHLDFALPQSFQNSNKVESAAVSKHQTIQFQSLLNAPIKIKRKIFSTKSLSPFIHSKMTGHLQKIYIDPKYRNIVIRYFQEISKK